MHRTSCARRCRASGSGSSFIRTAGDAEIQGPTQRDIAELDFLIDEILLASRLDANMRDRNAKEEVDLLALAAEECARYDNCALDGDRVIVSRRSAAVAAHDAQPAGECRAPRRAAGARGASTRRGSGCRGRRGCRRGRAGSRTGARVRAVSPAGRRARRAPALAFPWCARSRACTAAMRLWRRSRMRQAVSG